MATAADLLIRVAADTNAAAASLSSLKGSVNDLGASLEQTNADKLKASLEGAQATGWALAGIGAAIALGFKSGLDMAAGFEQQMSAVKSLLSPTQVQQFGKALEDLAIALGADTGLTVTTKEAAAGIEELIKAGIPAQAVLDGAAKAAIALSNATGISVAEAATFAATAMNAFHLKASDLMGVMNILNGVANATAADMNDLKFGFQAVSAVAAMVGMSFKETALALGIFAQNGLRGSDAGTSLKTMLMNLVPQTDKARAMMKELGIITADGTNRFFDQSGRVKDLTGIHEVLAGALKGMSTQQALATLNVLFGSDAIRAASILWRTSAADIDKYREAINSLEVLQTAVQRVDNLAGAQEVLGGVWEALNITIFRDFLPGIRQVLLWVANVVSEFVKMDPTLRTIIVALAGVAGAASILGGAFILLGPKIIEAVQGFTRLLPLFGSMLGPMALVAAGVAALLLAWTNNWFGIRDAVTAVVGPIVGQINLIWTAIDYLLKTGDWTTFLLRFEHLTGIDLSGIYNAIKNLIDVVQTLLRGDLLPFVQKVQALTGVNLLPVVIAFQEIKNAVTALLQGDLNAFNQYVRDLTGIDISGVTTAISNLVSWVKYLGSSPDLATFVARLQEATGIDLGPVVTWIQGMSAAVQALLAGNLAGFILLFQQLTGIDLSGVVLAVDRLVTLVKNLAAGDLATFTQNVKDWTGLDLSGFLVTLGKVGTLVGDIVRLDLGNFIVDFRDLTGVDLASFVAQAGIFVDAVSRLVTTGDLGPLLTWFKDLTGIDLSAVVAAIQNVVNAVSTLAGDVFRAFQDLVNGNIDLGGFFGRITTSIGTYYSTLFNAFVGLWQSIDWDAIWATVSGVGASVLSWLQGVWAGIPWAQVWASATGIGAGIAQGVLGIGGSVLAWLQVIWGGINWTLVWATATGIASSFATGVANIAGSVLGWLQGTWASIDWVGVWASATRIGSDLATGVSNIAGDVFAWLQGVWASIPWDQVWASIKATVAELPNIVANLQAWLKSQADQINWGDVWANIKGPDPETGGPNIFQQLENTLNALASDPVIQAFFKTIAGDMQRLRDIFAALQPQVDTLFSVLSESGKTILEVLGVLLGILGAIVSAAIPGLSQALFGIGQVVVGILGVIAAPFDLIRTVIISLVKLFQGDASGALAEWGGFFERTVNSVVTLALGLGNTLGGIFQALVDIIVSPFRFIYNLLVGQSIVPDLVLGIISWFAALRDTIGPVIDSIVGIIGGIGGTIQGALSSVGEWWNTTARPFFESIWNLLSNIGSIVNPLAWVEALVRLLFPNAGGGGGAGSGGNTYQVTVIIQGAGQSAQDITRAIFDALETLADEAPAGA